MGGFFVNDPRMQQQIPQQPQGAVPPVQGQPQGAPGGMGGMGGLDPQQLQRILPQLQDPAMRMKAAQHLAQRMPAPPAGMGMPGAGQAPPGALGQLMQPGMQQPMPAGQAGAPVGMAPPQMNLGQLMQAQPPQRY